MKTRGWRARHDASQVAGGTGFALPRKTDLPVIGRCQFASVGIFAPRLPWLATLDQLLSSNSSLPSIHPVVICGGRSSGIH